MGYLFIWALFGILSAVVASNKGRSSFNWFIVGFLLGPFGFLLSLVVQKIEPEKKEMLMECPFCAETIQAKARICRFCNREIPH